MADRDLAEYRLEWWNESRVRALYPHLSLDNYGATYEPKVGSLHPIKLLDGLWQAIASDPDAAHRVQLYCNVFVAAVAPARSRHRPPPRRHLPRHCPRQKGRLRHQRLHAHSSCRSSTRSSSRAAARSSPPTRSRSSPNHNFSCNEDDQYCDYMIKRVPTDGLVFGGARVHSKHPQKEDGRLDDDSIEPNVALALRQELRDIAGGSFQVTHEWTGCMAYTPDERALVGELPAQPRQAHVFAEHENNKNIPPTPLKPTGSGEYVMAGWCGNGMASIFATSKEFVHSLITDEWSNIPPELNCARFIEPIDGSN
jgi:glycine/D-amino acid oxidase-like deaminating enzyme